MNEKMEKNTILSAVKISLIIPVYNSEIWLPSCLNSLLSQTLREIEILCIDDGSTDSSHDILEHYAQKDSRIVIFTQPNAGASSARNKGLEMAKGQYIGFVDSDDLIHASFCEKLWNIAESTKADMVFCDYMLGDEKEKALSFDIQSFMVASEFFEMVPSLFSHFPFAIWNRIIRKSLLNRYQIRFDCELSDAEDFCFHYMTIPFCVSLAHVHEKLYYYRQRSRSLMHSPELYQKKHPQDQMTALNKVWSFLETHHLQETYRLEFLKICLSAIRHIRKTADSRMEFQKATKEAIEFFQKNSLYREKEDAKYFPVRKRIILSAWQSGKEGFDLTMEWKRVLKKLKEIFFRQNH